MLPSTHRPPPFLERLPKVIRYPFPLLAGAILGLFVLMPANEWVSWFEYGPGETDAETALQFVGHQMGETLTLRTPAKLLFYILLGLIVGSLVLFLLLKAQKRDRMIRELEAELQSDLVALIAQGESETLEFKSSYRYDLNQNKVNKALELVIMKTLAGMMNSEGGTLLIGVDDDGNIVGLENDYASLKRPDADGFEQLLMSSIAQKLGTPACEQVKVWFHQQEGKEVCRIRVMTGPRPVYVREGKESRFYIRTGAGTRAMDLEEAVSFIQTRWL